MEQGLAEQISSSDLIIVGIGSEWNWVKSGIKNDARYAALLEYCSHEGNQFLLPIIEYEYAKYNSDKRTEDAYKALRALIGDKKYFLISDIFLQDALKYGFDADRCVYPCGNYNYLQTSNPEDELIEGIEHFDYLKYKKRLNSFFMEYPNYNKGMASKKTVEWIKKLMRF